MNFDGETPFVRAALSGGIEVMRLLLEHGADPNIATTQGSTALMAAAGINWIPGQTLYAQRGGLCRSSQKALSGACRPPVNASNTLGLTAMHGAANRGWLSIMQMLADHGAKVNAKDKEGRTPMIFAQRVFLAVRPPVAKPEAIALLKELSGSSSNQ